MDLPKRINRGFPRQDTCNMCGKPYVAGSAAAKYCEGCRQFSKKKAIHEFYARNRSNQGIMPKPAPDRPYKCYNCDGMCRPGEICSECGTPYDLEKARAAWSRNAKPYMAIVRDNAAKTGNPKLYISRAIKTRKYADWSNWKEMDRKIRAFVRKKRARWVRAPQNKKDPV